MEKPETMAEASLRLSAAFGRLGAEMLKAVGAQTTANSAFLWAAKREVEAFGLWCRVHEIDPGPSIERLHRSELPIVDFLAAERSRLATENLNRWRHDG